MHGDAHADSRWIPTLRGTGPVEDLPQKRRNDRMLGIQGELLPGVLGKGRRGARGWRVDRRVEGVEGEENFMNFNEFSMNFQ